MSQPSYFHVTRLRVPLQCAKVGIGQFHWVVNYPDWRLECPSKALPSDGVASINRKLTFL